MTACVAQNFNSIERNEMSNLLYVREHEGRRFNYLHVLVNLSADLYAEEHCTYRTLVL